MQRGCGADTPQPLLLLLNSETGQHLYDEIRNMSISMTTATPNSTFNLASQMESCRARRYSVVAVRPADAKLSRFGPNRKSCTALSVRMSAKRTSFTRRLGSLPERWQSLQGEIPSTTCSPSRWRPTLPSVSR